MEQFELVTPDRTIAEPTIELTAQGVYDWQAGLLVCDAATLASTTISLQGRVGTLGNRTGNERRRRRAIPRQIWRNSGADSRRRRPGAPWESGPAKLSCPPRRPGHRCGSPVRSTTSSGSNARRPRHKTVPRLIETLWQEPRVQLDVDGFLPADGLTVQIAEGRLQTESVGCQLAGTVSPFSGSMLVDVQGNSNLNLDALSLRLRPWLGPNVQLSGTVEKPFRLRGPLQTAAPHLRVHHCS